MSPQIILFYSYYSDNCKKLLEYINYYRVEGIDLICIDSPEVRKKIENNNGIKLRYVPTLLLLYQDNSLELMEGERVYNFFQNIVEYSTTQIESEPKPKKEKSNKPKKSVSFNDQFNHQVERLNQNLIDEELPHTQSTVISPQPSQTPPPTPQQKPAKKGKGPPSMADLMGGKSTSSLNLSKPYDKSTQQSKPVPKYPTEEYQQNPQMPTEEQLAALGMRKEPQTASSSVPLSQKVSEINQSRNRFN